MHGHALELAVEYEPEEKSEGADNESAYEKRSPVDTSQEADLREIRNYEVRFSPGLVLHRDSLRRTSRRRRDRAVRAILSDTLRGGASRDYRQQRKSESKGTNNSRKLPIHSEFSKGE